MWTGRLEPTATIWTWLNGLITTQRSVRQIDLAVKINDGPAKAGLAHLKEGMVQFSGQHAGITAPPSKP